MCGISGVLAADSGAAALMPAVHAMHAALRHRGPDDEGVWCAPGGGAAFSHARLSILDLTAAGRQPMSLADRFTITYNGEIYNFLELRRELEQRGVAFKTRTDTEVILRLYEADGIGALPKLRGMFALAIWDERERTCVLARDRFGIKPLYVHTTDGRLVFASEVRGVLASGLVPFAIDGDALYGYFRTGSVPEPRTLVTNVRALEAGHCAIWKHGALTTQPYWQLRFDTNEGSATSSVMLTREALVDSVEHHFISDTPVGVFLSGGVDSTALVALARALDRRDLQTFSISFPGLATDEGPAAQRTADHFGTHHDEWALDGGAARQLFGRFLSATDQPSIDGLNTFAVSKLAHDRGLKVVLSGVGGDELFGGYPSFHKVPRLAAWRQGFRLAGPLRTAVAARLQRVSGRARWRRVGDLLDQPAGLTPAYETFRAIFTRAEASTLTEQYAGHPPRAGLETRITESTVSSNGHDPTAGDAISRLELARYMRNQLLRDADTMSMAWGLELRVPFLDNRLVDTLTAIPSATRLQPRKQLLLNAVPEVPPWVAGQDKRGFLFPFQQWLDAEWRDLFADLDRQARVPMETWYRKWSVFVLERWMEQRRQTNA